MKKKFDGWDLLAFPITVRNGIYRVIYVAKFEEALYVLHSFQKQTQQTSQHDKNIARTRYNRVVQQRRNSL